MIDLDQLQKAITPETILITIMFANNEIGTIEPVKEIGMIAKETRGSCSIQTLYRHLGQVPIDVDELNIDMLSSSAHKINGPKGIGCLYIRKGVKIRSFIHGGRPGEEKKSWHRKCPWNCRIWGGCQDGS